jgi:hypothetical protein
MRWICEAVQSIETVSERFRTILWDGDGSTRCGIDFWLHVTDTALSLVGNGTLTGLDVSMLIPTVED